MPKMMLEISVERVSHIPLRHATKPRIEIAGIAVEMRPFLKRMAQEWMPESGSLLLWQSLAGLVFRWQQLMEALLETELKTGA